MSTGTDIAALYREFTDVLTEVLAENAVGPPRRGRLARARAAVKKHPEYTEHAYFLRWRLLSHRGRTWIDQTEFTWSNKEAAA